MKMIKELIVLLVTGGLLGCASLGNVDRLRAENRQNILKLHIGMAKEEVLLIMDKKVVTDNLYGNKFTVNNPYKSEILQGKDKIVEVIYYCTDKKVSGYGKVVDDELTPLVFDKGKLIGWGWSFLQENIKRYEIRFR